MSERNEKVNQAISIIRHAREQIIELLRDSPDFVVRASHVLETLANGLSFSIGEPITQFSQDIQLQASSDSPARTIMGQKIPEKAIPIKEMLLMKNASDDITFLRENVQKIYDNFNSLSFSEILNTVSDIELRGVAKLSGLVVSKTEPARFTTAILQDMKERIFKQKSDKEQREIVLAQDPIAPAAKSKAKGK